MIFILSQNLNNQSGSFELPLSTNKTNLGIILGYKHTVRERERDNRRERQRDITEEKKREREITEEKKKEKE